MAPVSTDTIAPTSPSAAVRPQTRPHGTVNDSPMDVTWMGSKDGSVTLKPVPEFGEDLLAKRAWIKEHLAGAFQWFGKLGYSSGLAGHITVRDPILHDHFWMNPFGVHYSAVTVSKLVLVSPDGYVTKHGAQLPINTAGFFIHSAIHHARPELNAIAHMHTPSGMAWSVFGKPLDMLTQDACKFYKNHCVYPAFGGIVLAAEEGERIAAALGPSNMTAILQNHGLLTVGHTVDQCAYLFQSLERQCGVQLDVEAAAANGLKKILISDEDAAYTAASLQYWQNAHYAFGVEYDLLVEERGHIFLK